MLRVILRSLYIHKLELDFSPPPLFFLVFAHKHDAIISKFETEIRNNIISQPTRKGKKES